ncbi:MAG TPA: hypothetical protein DIU15_18545 [Deltaproteobacteria bacterium]|nr:hypothetical protein [Deltaproteobacteria bacterium]
MAGKVTILDFPYNRSGRMLVSSADYLEPRIIQTQSVCESLERLPELPVRILVLSSVGVEDPSRRGLAARLERRSSELGVGAGVVIHDAQFDKWDQLLQEPGESRYDAVFLRPSSLPADHFEQDRPADHVMDRLFGLLGDLCARFWLVDPEPNAGDEGALRSSEARRLALCRTLVGRGAPPAIMPSCSWEPDELARFHEDFFERALHDSPLPLAVGLATGSLDASASVVVPMGSRHGLDLGRLLENHRSRIDAASGSLAMLHREMEAVSALDGVNAGDVRAALAEDALQRTRRLDLVKDACDEINRDRDPAGWSRLSANIQQLAALESDIVQARSWIRSERGF